MADHDLPSPELLELWEPAVPQTDLAERVVTRWENERDGGLQLAPDEDPTMTRSNRKLLLAGSLLAAGALAALAGWQLLAPAPDDVDPVTSPRTPEERPASRGVVAPDDPAEVRRLYGELRQRDDRIAELEQQLEAATGAEPDGPEDPVRCASANRNTPGCSFLEPDPETLIEMARCGAVRVDIPSFMRTSAPMPPVDGEWREEADLTDEEAQALLDASEAFRGEVLEQMGELFLEAGGAPEAMEYAGEGHGIGVRGRQTMLDGLGDPTLRDAAGHKVARERAGLADPPDSLEGTSVEERTLRLYVGIGDAYEKVVAGVVGPERAREKRRQRDGWLGDSSIISGKCVD